MSATNDTLDWKKAYNTETLFTLIPKISGQSRVSFGYQGSPIPPTYLSTLSIPISIDSALYSGVSELITRYNQNEVSFRPTEHDWWTNGELIMDLVLLINYQKYASVYRGIRTRQVQTECQDVIVCYPAHRKNKTVQRHLKDQRASATRHTFPDLPTSPVCTPEFFRPFQVRYCSSLKWGSVRARC